MTKAYASMHGGSLASTLDAGVAGALDRLRTAWANHRTYRKTLAELRDLPTRALRDLDFNRGDLAAIAHREVYGHREEATARPSRLAGARTEPKGP